MACPVVKATVAGSARIGESTTHGFQGLLAFGLAVRGWALVQRNKAEDGALSVARWPKHQALAGLGGGTSLVSFGPCRSLRRTGAGGGARHSVLVQESRCASAVKRDSGSRKSRAFTVYTRVRPRLI
jgi:hypothetical protein